MKVLLVEDHADLAQWLARTLSQRNYAVEIAQTGSHADSLLITDKFDVVILDLQLPGMDGREVLRRLRSRRNAVPVLILTAFDAVKDRIVGLDCGADDYMTKPFDVHELEARLRALLRRSHSQPDPRIRCGSLEYDTNSRVFSDHRGALSLTPREHAVLETLIVKAGKTVSKRALAHSLFANAEDVNPEAIEIYVHRLRRKLELTDAVIVTLRGLGYLLKSSHAAT